MQDKLIDQRIKRTRPLIHPDVLADDHPITETAAATVLNGRLAASSILSGNDDRLLVVVGPCSIHDTKSALEYASRLQKMRRKLRGELEIMMRVYFEKPRTTVGWKGFINDPLLDGSCRINDGLREGRKLLLAIAEMKVPAGTEFLDTITPQYIAEAVSWGAIGARTTESPTHRQLASGLSMPIGFKNGTDGNIQIALDAINAAKAEHSFLSVTKGGNAAIVDTWGNELCHLILRGGNGKPNYDESHIKDAVQKLQKSKLHPNLMVDLSHGNSDKDHRKQPEVAKNLAEQISKGECAISGVMIESHLVEGAQKLSCVQDLVYGQSITDACISWETTEHVLIELADAVRNRRMQAD